MSWAELRAELSRCEDYRTLRALCQRARALPEPEGGVPVRFALLGDASTDLLVEPLAFALRAAGLRPEVHAAPYGRVVPEMLDPASGTSAFEPDVALALLVPGKLPGRPDAQVDAAGADALAKEVCEAIFAPCKELHERCGTEVVLNTLPPLPHRPWGNLGARLPEDDGNFVRRVNVALGDTAPPYVHLHDVAALAERRGLDRWHDPRLWYQAKQAIAPNCVPEYVRDAAAFVAALLGRTRKCLVVDLDDTLWGGIVGEVGVEGLELGEGTARGEAFKDLQLYLKRLAARGILLAVCSKNEEAAALAPLAEHPETVLRREDFVAFHANWQPKSDNLRAIAAELDLGLDAFVFLDDNPAEREEVRLALPAVAVPEPTDDPASFIEALERGRFFEAARVTAEDRRRGEMYRGRVEAQKLEASCTDLGEYLRSLAMEAVVRPFEPVSFERVTQLINKTNQLNLTTTRVTQAEIERMAADPERVTLSARLADRFGDHGLVAACFGRAEGDALDIEGWVMSCRVLGRGLSRAILNELARAAADRGLAEIRGTFAPSGRNEPAREHYAKLGFAQAAESNGATTWSLALESFEPLDHAIRVDTP